MCFIIRFNMNLLNVPKLKELDFNNSLKYASYKELEYYKKHKDDEIYYPFI